MGQRDFVVSRHVCEHRRRACVFSVAQADDEPRRGGRRDARALRGQERGSIARRMAGGRRLRRRSRAASLAGRVLISSRSAADSTRSSRAREAMPSICRIALRVGGTTDLNNPARRSPALAWHRSIRKWSLWSAADCPATSLRRASRRSQYAVWGGRHLRFSFAGSIVDPPGSAQFARRPGRGLRRLRFLGVSEAGIAAVANKRDALLQQPRSPSSHASTRLISE